MYGLLFADTLENQLRQRRTHLLDEMPGTLAPNFRALFGDADGDVTIGLETTVISPGP